jgi:hypothetical protein
MPPEESPEAKFDRLKKQLQDSILRDYPNPERKGCPGDTVLRALAGSPLEQAVEDDPHWHHITHCSECYREFLAFNNALRSQTKARRTRFAQGFAIAAVVLLLVLVGLKRGYLTRKRPQNAEVAYAKKTIIIPSMERSGNAGEQEPNTLNREPEELTVQLPVGSKPGAYELQLTRNKRTVLSSGGNAEIHNGTTSFTIKVDLSKFDPGKYSMVVRQVPYDWNLYPVVIQ